MSARPRDIQNPLTCTIIEDLAGLAALEPAWWHLWTRSPAATPFQTPAMLMAYWREFMPGKLETIAVFEGDHLIGLAPLYFEMTEQGARLVPLGIGPCDSLDVLVDPEHHHCVLNLMSDAIAAQGYRCDLEYAPDDANALKIPTPQGWREACHAQQVVLITSLQSADLQTIIPSRQRRKWRMAEHRAERRGGYHIVQTCTDTLDKDLDQLFRMHTRRWENAGEQGVFHGVNMRQFIRKAARGLLERGHLILNTVLIGECPAGVFLGFKDARAYYAFASGFDPRFAYESPGTLLIGHALSQACAAGAMEFNWLRDDEPYKIAWGARPHHLFRRSLVPPAFIPPAFLPPERNRSTGARA